MGCVAFSMLATAAPRLASLVARRDKPRLDTRGDVAPDGGVSELSRFADCSEIAGGGARRMLALTSTGDRAFRGTLSVETASFDLR